MLMIFFKSDGFGFERNFTDAIAISRQLFFLVQERMTKQNTGNVGDFGKRQHNGFLVPPRKPFPKRLIFLHKPTSPLPGKPSKHIF